MKGSAGDRERGLTGRRQRLSVPFPRRRLHDPSATAAEVGISASPRDLCA